MGHGDAGGRLSPVDIEAILRSARRAGTFLIVPRHHGDDAIGAMRAAGLLRDRVGHLVLTPKGEQRRRDFGILHAA